jgi:hypothetical protein
MLFAERRPHFISRSVCVSRTEFQASGVYGARVQAIRDPGKGRSTVVLILKSQPALVDDLFCSILAVVSYLGLHVVGSVDFKVRTAPCNLHEPGNFVKSGRFSNSAEVLRGCLADSAFQVNQVTSELRHRASRSSRMPSVSKGVLFQLIVFGPSVSSSYCLSRLKILARPVILPCRCKCMMTLWLCGASSVKIWLWP